MLTLLWSLAGCLNHPNESDLHVDHVAGEHHRERSAEVDELLVHFESFEKPGIKEENSEPEVIVDEPEIVVDEPIIMKEPQPVKIASVSAAPTRSAPNKKYRVATAVVTAYAPFDNQSGTCTDGDPTNTATGTYPKHGTVAADPSRLPYGTEIFIPGYGHGVIEDTGGALRNDKVNLRLDVFVDTYKEAIAFGRKTMEVRIYR